MKPTVKLQDGMIHITEGVMTAKEAIWFGKVMADLVKQAKREYCANGHRITEETSRVEMMSSGYAVRRCLICRDNRTPAFNNKPSTRDARTDTQ